MQSNKGPTMEPGFKSVLKLVIKDYAYILTNHWLPGGHYVHPQNINKGLVTGRLTCLLRGKLVIHSVWAVDRYRGRGGGGYLINDENKLIKSRLMMLVNYMRLDNMILLVKRHGCLTCKVYMSLTVGWNNAVPWYNSAERIAEKQVELYGGTCLYSGYMKGCICHFIKWQIHPFISKKTVFYFCFI